MRIPTLSRINGNTLIPINAAINMEQIGSAIIQPYMWIKADEMITPTLPNVSANICRNTPGNRKLTGYSRSLRKRTIILQIEIIAKQGSPADNSQFYLGIFDFGCCRAWVREYRHNVLQDLENNADRYSSMCGIECVPMRMTEQARHVTRYTPRYIVLLHTTYHCLRNNNPGALDCWLPKKMLFFDEI